MVEDVFAGLSRSSQNQVSESFHAALCAGEAQNCRPFFLFLLLKGSFVEPVRRVNTVCAHLDFVSFSFLPLSPRRRHRR